MEYDTEHPEVPRQSNQHEEDEDGSNGISIRNVVGSWGQLDCPEST